MLSLASLAKNMLLVRRVGRRTLISSLQSELPDPVPIAPLPHSLSERIPQELYERIIECLANDKTSLLRCSLVCRAWWPACRYRLRKSLSVLPNVIVTNAQALGMNCGTPLRGTTYILYGSHNGIYIMDRRRRTAPRRVIEAGDVVQLDVMEDENLLVFLSENQLMTHPLDTLPTDSGLVGAECTRIAKQVSFFKVGFQQGRRCVCLVKSSNVLKIMHTVPSPIPGRSMLALHREFYVPAKVTSVSFLKTKMVLGFGQYGFEVVHIETLSIQSLLDPSVSMSDLTPAKCISTHRTRNEILVSYDTFARYIDKAGRVSRLMENTIFWRKPVHTTIVKDEYILAFSRKHIEIRYLETGQLLQTIWIKHSLLCDSPDSIAIQAVDGRLIELEFPR